MKHEKSLRFIFSLILGSISFLFFSAASTFVFPFVLLGYVSQMPLFILGFTLGYGEVLIAGAFGILLNFLFAGEAQLISYAIFYVLPVIFLMYVLNSHKEKEKTSSEKFRPIEIILGQCFSLIGVSLVVLFFFIFENPEAQVLWKKSITQLLATFSQDEKVILSPLLDVFVHYLPALISVAWMMMTLGNITLAQIISKRWQKKITFSLRIKNWMVLQWQYWLLASALTGALFLNDSGAIFAHNLAFVALVPFLIEGLSVFHDVYPKFIKGQWGIVAFYGFVFLLGWPILALVCLGLFEPWFLVRQRFNRKLYQK